MGAISSGGGIDAFRESMTAASSLSVDPMSIILSINRNAAAHAAILASRKLCPNMLAPEQDDLAMRFAGTLGYRGEGRFDADDWLCESGRPPMLRDAAAALQCELVEAHTFGTHSVLLCVVNRVHLGASPTALVYANRQCGTVRHAAAGTEI